MKRNKLQSSMLKVKTLRGCSRDTAEGEGPERSVVSEPVLIRGELSGLNESRPRWTKKKNNTKVRVEFTKMHIKKLQNLL